MSRQQIRLTLPFAYVILIAIGFLISSPVGISVTIIGAIALGLSYSLLRPEVGRPRPERAGREAARRARRDG